MLSLESVRHDIYQQVVMEVGSHVNNNACDEVFGEGGITGDKQKHAFHLGTEILLPHLEFIQSICGFAIEAEWISSGFESRDFSSQEYEEFSAACLFRACDVVYQLFGEKIEKDMREFKSSLK